MDPTYQGFFLMLQGGLHLKSEAQATFASIVKPILCHPTTYATCVKHNKIDVVFVRMLAHS
jgi:hypothetical protein